MTDIAGRCALITGAANGIGRILAEELAEAGASLVLWDIDARGLERIRDGLMAAGHIIIPCLYKFIGIKKLVVKMPGRDIIHLGPEGKLYVVVMIWECLIKGNNISITYKTGPVVFTFCYTKTG